MKEMVIIIRPEKLEKVKQIMDHEKLGGISISSVMGCGTQRGVEETGFRALCRRICSRRSGCRSSWRMRRWKISLPESGRRWPPAMWETERSSSGTWRTRCGSEPGSMGTELYNRSGKV